METASANLGPHELLLNKPPLTLVTDAGLGLSPMTAAAAGHWWDAPPPHRRPVDTAVPRHTTPTTAIGSTNDEPCTLFVPFHDGISYMRLSSNGCRTLHMHYPHPSRGDANRSPNQQDTRRTQGGTRDASRPPNQQDTRRASGGPAIPTNHRANRQRARNQMEPTNTKVGAPGGRV